MQKGKRGIKMDMVETKVMNNSAKTEVESGFRSEGWA